MDKKAKIKRLITHLEALNKSYDNIIEIMNSDLKKKFIEDPEDKDAEKIEVNAMNEAQIKIWMQGQVEGALSSNALLKEIEDKEKELEDLQKPPKKDGEPVVGDKKRKGNNMNQHLV